MASVENLKFYRVIDNATGEQINYVIWDLVEFPDTTRVGTNVTLMLDAAGPYRERLTEEPPVPPPLPPEALAPAPIPPADDEPTP